MFAPFTSVEYNRQLLGLAGCLPAMRRTLCTSLNWKHRRGARALGVLSRVESQRLFQLAFGVVNPVGACIRLSE